MSRGLSTSFTTGTATASGGTVGHHKTGLPNTFNILGIKIVPSAGSGPSTIIVTQKDTLSTTDLVLEYKAASGNIYDPMDYTSGSPAEMPATDIIACYDDEDLTGEFHMKFTNNDSVDKTYTVTLYYEEVPIFDSSRVATFRKLELIDDILYFGGRTASQARINRSSTTFNLELGDGSGPAGLAAGPTAITGTLSVSGHPTLEGVTATGATGTGKIVYDTAPTFQTSIDLEASAFFRIDSGVNGVMLRKSAAGTMALQNYNNTALANFQVQDIDLNGALSGGSISGTLSASGGLTGTINYLDHSSVPQSFSFLDGIAYP